MHMAMGSAHIQYGRACVLALLVWYDMYSRRIFVLKLIFLALLGWLGVQLLKNNGVQIFRPLHPLLGAFPPRDPLRAVNLPISANN